MFFNANNIHPNHFNTANIVEILESYDQNKLHSAIKHLVLTNDELRMKFTKTDSGWVQEPAVLTDVPFEVFNLSELTIEQQKRKQNKLIILYPL